MLRGRARMSLASTINQRARTRNAEASPPASLAAALLMLRVPALAQPMGADQGLYAYVGERILAGELPYRDAWDQKPPAIHYTYALMRAAWPGDGAVGAADLLAAGTVAWLLYRLGTVTGSSAAGAVSALVFLLLSNPSLTRLGGIRLRAQCETFIAVVVAGGLLLLLHRTAGTRPVRVLAAGILFGLAFLFKYNAGIYLRLGRARGVAVAADRVARLDVAWRRLRATPDRRAGDVHGGRCARRSL